ncbi:MAG: polyprenyl synthetase family protein [Eubacterium sp.]|nr:polyprenyl synthetase family protein [Eubacterium sp.]
MERVKFYIDKFTSNSLEGTRTGAVLRDVTGSSGKMVRPRLLLLCSAFGMEAKERFESLCMYAAMVEMTHMASLIHDDIVDEAAYRRGELSIQKKYGKDSAVYAGDFLISRVNYRLALECRNDVSALLSKTIEEMCIGEIGQAMYRYDQEMTVDRYLSNIKGKTAALFKAACTIGAMESGCDQETVELLRQLGEYIGIIFQLRDDLMDFISDASVLGKETHKDFLDGIYTMPVLMAKQTLSGGNLLTELFRKNARKEITESDLVLMEEIVREEGGIRATIARIHNYTSVCRELLNTMMDRDIPRRAPWDDEQDFHDQKMQSVRMIKRMLDKFDEI